MPTSEAATSLGGQPAARLVYQFTNDQGQDVTFVDDIIGPRPDGLGGLPGDRRRRIEDIPVFDQFVATFQFTD